ncbi:MAG: extracellular solute-binding protein [Ruminococcaceae bacterium]|nr:extracellular solute-binding protein [Oscillospiraceae bacterium]
MKRFLSIVLAMVMLLGILCGCGSKGGDNGVTKVRVWTSDAGGKSVWESLVKEFNETTGKEKGIEIVWETRSDFNTSIEVARKNNQLPEIASVSDVAGYAKTGDIIPLKDMPGGLEFLEEYNPPLTQGRNIIGDVVYNVPSSSNVPALVYNKDLFKAAGLVDENGEAKAPETWEEVREYAKKLTDTKKQVYGIGLPLKDYGVVGGYMLRSHFAATFGYIDKYDFENIEVNFDNFKYPFELLLGFKEDKSHFPGAESLDNDTMRAYFAEGKIGMFLGLSWDVGVLTTQFLANCDWGVAPVPVAEGYERLPNWRDISGSYTICKSANDIDKEKVMEVYKFIFSLNTRKTIYENGIRIPCKKDAIEVADTSKIPPQFSDFANLLDEEFEVIVSPSLKLEGYKWDEAITKVWAGDVSVDDAVNDLSKRYTEAFKKGVEDGSIDPSYYLD